MVEPESESEPKVCKFLAKTSKTRTRLEGSDALQKFIQGKTFMGTYVPPDHGILRDSKDGPHLMDHEDCLVWFQGILKPTMFTVLHVVVLNAELSDVEGIGLQMEIYEDSKEATPTPPEASKPEPDPINRGIPVTKALISWLNTKDTSDEGVQNAINLVRARDAFGKNKYGQPLMTKDGRDTVEDAVQELGDLLQYIYKAKLNNEDISPIRRMMPVLLDLVDSIQ